MSITFKKGQTWQCMKCNQTLAVTFPVETTEAEVFLMLLTQHKKVSADCSAPSGFGLVKTFMKHEETK
jgi:predicted transcriptional regulator